MPLAGTITHQEAAREWTRFDVILSPADQPLNSLPERGVTLLECLRAIPGMMEFVSSHNVMPEIVRFAVEVTIRENAEDVLRQQWSTRVLVHPGGPIEELLNNIICSPLDVDRIDYVGYPAGGGVLHLRGDRINGSPKVLLPSGSVWNEGKVRLWPRQMPLNEFGYFYVALFIAGNYARYYPDLWLADVEQCTPLALAVEELLWQAERRMACLTLSELTGTYHVPAAR
jgi:hypothetical protein